MAIHLSSCKAVDTPEELMMVGVIHYNKKQLNILRTTRNMKYPAIKMN